MKKIKFLIATLFIAIFFSLHSCGEVEPVDGFSTATTATAPNTSTPNTPTNPTTPPPTTPPITTPGGGTSSGDYWPAAINNQWVFKTDGVLQSPMKIISLNTISGKNYYTFNQQSGSAGGANVTATSRLRKLNGDYYIKMENFSSPANGVIPGFTMSGYETLFIKDYLPVGGAWTDSYTQTTTYTDPMYPVISMDFDITATVLEKNSSITIAGHNYTDVIKIKYIQKVTGFGQTTIITNYYWYAKNIGPIKIVSESNGQTIIQELDSYIVK